MRKALISLCALCLLGSCASGANKSELSHFIEAWGDGYISHLKGYYPDEGKILSVTYRQLEYSGYVEDWHYITAKCEVIWANYYWDIKETDIFCTYSHSADYNESQIQSRTILQVAS